MHQDLNPLEAIGHFYSLMMRLKKIGKFFMPAGMLLKITLLFHGEFTILGEHLRKLTMMMIQPMVLGGILRAMG